MNLESPDNLKMIVGARPFLCDSKIPNLFNQKVPYDMGLFDYM
jgi:hypothetical protein